MIRDQKDSTFGKKSNVWLLFEFRKGALLTFKRFFEGVVRLLTTPGNQTTEDILWSPGRVVFELDL